MNTQDIYSSLRSKVCPSCKGPKKAAQSFCRPCYSRLPMSHKNSLYDAQIYVATFNESLEILEAKNPVK